MCTQHSTFICSLLKLATARGLHGLSLSLSLSPCAFAPFQDASLGLRSDALLKEALSKPRPRAEATLNPVRQQKIIGDRDPSVLGKRGPDQSWVRRSLAGRQPWPGLITRWPVVSLPHSRCTHSRIVDVAVVVGERDQGVSILRTNMRKRPMLGCVNPPLDHVTNPQSFLSCLYSLYRVLESRKG